MGKQKPDNEEVIAKLLDRAEAAMIARLPHCATEIKLLREVEELKDRIHIEDVGILERVMVIVRHYVMIKDKILREAK